MTILPILGGVVVYSGLSKCNVAMPEFTTAPVYYNSAAVEKLSSVA